MEPARTASDWPEAQRLMFDAASMEELPQTVVEVAWWTNESVGPLTGLLGAVAGLVDLCSRRGRGPAGAYAALWRQRMQDGFGQTPELVVNVDAYSLPSPEGDGRGIVYGEYAPNGAMVLMVNGCRIAPTYNPRVPWGDLAKRFRS